MMLMVRIISLYSGVFDGSFYTSQSQHGQGE